jgi:hypothetical protein
MRPAPRNRKTSAPVALALASVGLLAAPGALAAAPVNTTVSAAPASPPPTVGPAPRASADAKRMYAVTFTNMVVWENGAGYLHAFWRTLGSAGPDNPARLQWGRGCPEVSDRTFTALHTAFSNPDRFFLIVEKSPDARQPGAFCVTSVEIERISAAHDLPRAPAPGASPPPSPPQSGSAPPPFLKK